LKTPLNSYGGIFDYDQAKTRLIELDGLSESPDIWKDQAKARDILKERTYLSNFVNSLNKVETDLVSLKELAEMASDSSDAEVIGEVVSELKTLAELARTQEVECLFSGEADANDCFVEVHAGAGGTESHDWSDMLLRMYLRWAERHNYKVELIDKLDGEEAGIKSATLKIIGNNAYGWMKLESGIHRLVRISPFNAAGKRHTSFASIWVYPVVDESINIEINESDLRIDTYRSSGAGGQHVNTTDSAVRITHIPTGIVVQCQNGRSQHRNKEECYKMLRSRLYEFELKKKMEAVNAQNAAKTDIGWGNQIRSYVLQPYQMVKDNRTGHEDTDSNSVLDGNLDEFMRAMLENTVKGKGMKDRGNV
jgi:peptide chain release factor 2